MAAEPKGGGAPRIRLDDLTGRIVPEPKSSGDSILVSGFLGASTDAEHTRIYWDASMSSHLDVSTADIIHTEPMPKEQSPLGGSYVWLKRSAFAQSGAQGGNPMTGRFFEGPLMAAYGAQFGGGGAAPAAAPQMLPSLVCSYGPGCWYSWGFCPTMFGCPPLHTQHCPQVQVPGGAEAAAAPAFGTFPSLNCTYAPGCWYSYAACPSLYGCGPHHTPNCPQMQAQAAPQAGAGAAYGAFPSLYCTYVACPTHYGCGPFHTPNCPRMPAQAGPGPEAAGAAFGAFPSLYCTYVACPTYYGCGPFRTPNCPRIEQQTQVAAQFWTAQYCPWTAVCSVGSCGHPCLM